MADLASFTTVFRASEPRRAKRNRQAVSCTACQKRKSRCDRRHPCGTCEKRGDVAGCRFITAGADGIAPPTTNGHGTVANGGNRHEVLSRLTKLEEMVKGLAEKSQSRSQTNGGVNDDVEAGAVLNGVHGARLATAAASTGASRTTNGSGPGPDAPAVQVGVTDDDTVYHGPTSWASLVESIHDIQSALEAEDAEIEALSNQSPPVEDRDIMFGGLASVTTADIVECLPPRQDADKLVAAYFGSKFVATPFIHSHHFRRRYEAFWKDPESSNVLWVSILFSVLSMGAMIARTRDMSTTSPGSVASPQVYTTMAARCLVSGRYLQAQAFSVEALLAHAHSRNVRGKDLDPELWSLYGLAVRVAQRRGYHRDPRLASAALCSVTPFEAEMRRRIWLMIRSYDMMFSFQQGMPPMVQEADCDVALPTNITDDDFDEDTVEMPPARPTNDPLTILPYICKGKFLPTLRRVIQRSLGVNVPPYEQVEELNADLLAWHNDLPQCVRFRPIRETSFADQNHTIMHRIMLELIFQMARCVLNCTYLNPPPKAEGDASTRARQKREAMDVCRDAALSIMRIHLEVDRELKPGGRLHEDRYMVSNLAMTDFLNAAMFIGVDLTDGEETSPENRLERVSILRAAYDAWAVRISESKDAVFATKVLRAILRRVEASTSAPSSSSGAQTLVQESPDKGAASVGDGDKMQPPTMSWDLGAAMQGGFPDQQQQQQQLLNFDELPPLDNFFNNMEPFDWSELNRYYRNDFEMSLD